MVLAFFSIMVIFAPAGLSALFTATTTGTGNTLTTSSCFQAQVGSVQTGTFTNSTNGTQTIAIGAVDPTKSFLMFSTAHNSNRPVAEQLRGTIAGATTITFDRNTNEGSPATITGRWYVVQYTCGVKVQRGTVTLAGTGATVPITPVASLSQAFVTFSQTSVPAESQWEADNQLAVDLSNPSTVQITAGATSSQTVSWQVVEFTNPRDINVQRGTASMSGTT